MKTVVAIALILFGAFMSYVFIGGFLEKNEDEKPVQSVNQQDSAPTQISNESNQSTQSTAKTFTEAEIASRNTKDNCWLIIDSKVYDVSKFISEHPGGSTAITPYCGKEAGKAFETQDKGSSGGHSNNARQMLSEYQIGTLQI